MKTEEQQSPLKIEVSFKKVFDQYKGRLSSDNALVQQRAVSVLEIADKFPELSTGISDLSKIGNYKNQIDLVMEDMFSSILENNEIKIATIPYNDFIFKTSERFQKIIKNAGPDFKVQLNNFTEDEYYILGCVIIMNFCYGFKADFSRPLYFKIPSENGITKHYRLLYNADFVEIIKTKKAPKFVESDFEELLDNFDKIALWKEKFPPGSYIFKGFILANMFDATADVNISDFKASLINDKAKKEMNEDNFRGIFASVFNCPDLRIGFSEYNTEDNTLDQIVENTSMSSFILCGKKSLVSEDALCQVSYYTLFKQNEFYTVSNASRYHELYPDNSLYRKLMDQEIESAIFAPIVDNGKLLGIMELVSPTKNALNSVNANKLRDMMPFLNEYVIQAKENVENELELIIQEECTSIHKSVHWKFRKEAKRYARSIALGNQATFREAVFDDVYPLFGQIDIKGSSEARNLAVKDDLELQLHHVEKIVRQIYVLEKLPIYEQLSYRIDSFLKDLQENFQVDSERSVLKFLKSEIIPLFKHLSKKNETLKTLIAEYNELVESNTGFVYKHRKDYDESVMQINKRMASVIDRNQRDAQQMYPHYFERFKTDGVEHNMYIGESITKEKSFNKIYLYNLRLWQLQVMCEMENSYYKMKETLPIPLDVASMILVFNSSLALRFRMDEKRFDVDGTYNARYEVIKKRVDKANVKGTEDRITQAGKIAIIYSQKEDEKEYLKYIQFLQTKKHLDTEIEILELEDLQGVTGLKAIRVPILYTRGGKEKSKEYYTYEDLIEQLN
ncbi:hypothetical protein ULMS_27330 [Patiriisocius marinistellae]|uniref:GAF domain-containing protein n=1 Tax=Patiriisocius marinistellae TaxID=2494560 RepID=A0A5J4G3A0_9FLAO|nr:GAF domain-containing protein [Patiriisocius marinistellae]GEQ87225.1 hypothetical protein ULMS_27330 [Patiriisocius marinistellae]